VETLDVIEKEDIRGFRLATILDPTVPEFTANGTSIPGSLEGPHFQLLSTLRHTDGFAHAHSFNEVLFLKEISHNGVCYGTYTSSHYRNSAVIFRRGLNPSPEEESHNQAGVVQNIFEHSCFMDGQPVAKDYFLTLNIHSPINRVGFRDPYLPFGFAAGYICESKPVETVVIKLSQVVSHFVLTPMEEIDAIHVLPVDRVRNPYDIAHYYNMLTMTLQLMLEFVMPV
jgi:hypothetical protein